MTAPLTLKRTVFLVDDHPMFRRGLAESLNGEEDLFVCGQSSGESNVVEDVVRCNPDLVILDVSLRNRSGLDILRDLLGARPNLNVLLVSMHDEALYAERALRGGARGYMMKHEEPAKMFACIRHILNGHVYLSENASSEILQNLTAPKDKGSRFAVDLLSQREFEVFELLAQRPDHFRNRRSPGLERPHGGGPLLQHSPKAECEARHGTGGLRRPLDAIRRPHLIFFVFSRSCDPKNMIRPVLLATFPIHLGAFSRGFRH